MTSVDELIKRADSSDPETRLNAVFGLMDEELEIPDMETALQVYDVSLDRMVHDEDAGVRLNAMSFMFKKFYPVFTAYRQGLVKDQAVKENCIMLRDRFTAALAEMLYDDSLDIRSFTSIFLGEVAREASVEPLLKSFENGPVNLSTLRILGHVGTAEIDERLIAAFESHRNQLAKENDRLGFVSCKITELTEIAALRGFSDDEFIDLISELSGRIENASEADAIISEHLHSSLLETLASIKSPKVIKLAMDALDSTSGKVICSALKAVEIGFRMKPGFDTSAVFEKVKDLMENHTTSVQIQALQCLTSFHGMNFDMKRFSELEGMFRRLTAEMMEHTDLAKTMLNLIRIRLASDDCGLLNTVINDIDYDHYIRNGDVTIRCYAIEILGVLARVESTQLLLDLLNDPQGPVIDSAIEALGALVKNYKFCLGSPLPDLFPDMKACFERWKDIRYADPCGHKDYDRTEKVDILWTIIDHFSEVNTYQATDLLLPLLDREWEDPEEDLLGDIVDVLGKGDNFRAVPVLLEKLPYISNPLDYKDCVDYLVLSGDSSVIPVLEQELSSFRNGDRKFAPLSGFLSVLAARTDIEEILTKAIAKLNSANLTYE